MGDLQIAELVGQSDGADSDPIRLLSVGEPTAELSNAIGNHGLAPPVRRRLIQNFEHERYDPSSYCGEGGK